MTPPVRVLIADDHPTFRQGLRAVLAQAEDVEVVADAPSGELALELCARHEPDVVLMDVLMPGIGGLEAIRRLRTEHPDVAVVVLTMSSTDESIFTALRLGARGYLLKESPGQEILEGVRRVAAGQALYDASVASRITAYLASGPVPHPFPELSAREREVLALLADGLGNGEIARRLQLAPKTVRNIVSTVLAKLHVTTRAEAGARARAAGLGDSGT